MEIWHPPGMPIDLDLFAPLELKSKLLCDVDLVPQQGGPGRVDSPWGAHVIDYIESGEFEGPRLRGKVLPGGGDWPSLSNDGKHSMRLDVRAVWQTDDGAKLFVRYYGFIVFPERPEPGAGSLAEMDPSSFYFRTAPTFQTGDERYSWLNKVLCVGVGRFTPSGLGYRIFEIE